MKSFLVEIKAKDKSAAWSYKIDSQDEKTAEQWAEKCLSAQKRDPSKYRAIATEIVKEAPKPTEEKPVEERPRKRTKSRSA